MRYKTQTEKGSPCYIIVPWESTNGEYDPTHLTNPKDYKYTDAFKLLINIKKFKNSSSISSFYITGNDPFKYLDKLSYILDELKTTNKPVYIQTTCMSGHVGYVKAYELVSFLQKYGDVITSLEFYLPLYHEFAYKVHPAFLALLEENNLTLDINIHTVIKNADLGDRKKESLNKFGDALWYIVDKYRRHDIIFETDIDETTPDNLSANNIIVDAIRKLTDVTIRFGEVFKNYTIDKLYIGHDLDNSLTDNTFDSSLFRHIRHDVNEVNGVAEIEQIVFSHTGEILIDYEKTERESFKKYLLSTLPHVFPSPDDEF